MKLGPDNKYFRWGLTAFLTAAAGILFYFVIFHMRVLKSGIDLVIAILMPVIYGLLISYVLWPLVRIFETKLFGKILKKMKVTPTAKGKKAIRLTCVLATLFLFLFAIYLLLALLIPQVANSNSQHRREFSQIYR